MGSLVHLAEQLTKKKYDPVEAAAYDKAPDPVSHTFQQKEVAPLKRSNELDHSPATKRQRGWIYYNLKLSTYKVSISKVDMSVLIERSQRNSEEKAKVKFRLLQMGAKEVA